MSLWTMTDDEAGKPKYLSDELRNAQTVSDKDATIGINAAEAQDAGSIAKGLVTPGWVTYTTYTDQHGNTRHKSEVLVAAGSLASDGVETLVDDLSTGTIFVKPTDFDDLIYSAGGMDSPTGTLQLFGPSVTLQAALVAIPVGGTFTVIDDATSTTFTVTVDTQWADMAGWSANVTFNAFPGNGQTFNTITA